MMLNTNYSKINFFFMNFMTDFINKIIILDFCDMSNKLALGKEDSIFSYTISLFILNNTYISSLILMSLENLIQVALIIPPKCINLDI